MYEIALGDWAVIINGTSPADMPIALKHSSGSLAIKFGSFYTFTSINFGISDAGSTIERERERRGETEKEKKKAGAFFLIWLRIYAKRTAAHRRRLPPHASLFFKGKLY
jgi:hypothetical protein